MSLFKSGEIYELYIIFTCLPIIFGINIFLGRLALMMINDLRDASIRIPYWISNIEGDKTTCHLFGIVTFICVSIFGTFIFIARPILYLAGCFKHIKDKYRSLVKEQRKNKGWDE